jgi:hypothetical protein
MNLDAVVTLPQDESKIYCLGYKTNINRISGSTFQTWMYQIREKKFFASKRNEVEREQIRFLSEGSSEKNYSFFLLRFAKFALHFLFRFHLIYFRFQAIRRNTF